MLNKGVKLNTKLILVLLIILLSLKFVISAQNPTANLILSDTKISKSQSINIDCNSDSSAKEYLIEVNKPSGKVISKNTHSTTLSGSDTDEAGVYNVICEIKDEFGKTTAVQMQFTTFFSTSDIPPKSSLSLIPSSNISLKIGEAISIICESSELENVSIYIDEENFCKGIKLCNNIYLPSVAGNKSVECKSSKEKISINMDITENECISEFECEEWSKCSTEEIQNRNCRDKNNCKEDKPETKNCDNIECVNNNDCKEDYECKNNKCKLEGSENVTDNTFTILNDNPNENVSDNATFIERNISLINSSNLTTIVVFIGLGIILLFTFMSLLIKGDIKNLSKRFKR